MISDDLLEHYAEEYIRKSTKEWGMTFREFLEIKMECNREVNETLLEAENGEGN